MFAEHNEKLRRKNKWVAFILCMLIGWTGAHKFYEAKIAQGVICLVFCGLISMVCMSGITDINNFAGVYRIFVTISLIIILLKPNTYYV